MSETPVTGGDYAAAPPVDAAPAPAPAAAPVDHAAIAAAVVTALQNAGAVPAPTTTAPTTGTATAPATTAATTAAPAPVDGEGQAPALEPGNIAFYKVERLGRTRYDVMLVLGAFTATGPDGEKVPKLRLLPIGSARGYAELPASEVTPAAAFDWEAAA